MGSYRRVLFYFRGKERRVVIDFIVLGIMTTRMEGMGCLSVQGKRKEGKKYKGGLWLRRCSGRNVEAGR